MEWIIFALVAAFLFGFQTILKKKVLKKQDTFEFLTLLYLINFLILLPFIFSVNLFLSSYSLFLIFVRSVLMLVAIVSFTEALKHLPISTVTPLSNLKPLFTLVLGFIILSETIGPFQIVGVIVIIMGSYLLDSEGNLKDYKKPLKTLIESRQIHYILIFAVFYSLGAILSKTILKTIGPLDLLFYHSLFSVFLYFAIIFIFYSGVKDLKNSWNMAGFWIILIAILGVLASYTSFLSFASIDSKVILIVPILQVSNLISVVLGGKIFKEKHIGIKIIASILMITGVVLILI
ncbi:MAG: DMT family transporter [Nanoarchaeota archaeon]